MTEFDANFKGKRIQVLWPDTDTWYNAEVLKVNVKARTATLFYTDSKEKEEINLYEAMLNMEVSWPLKGAAVGTKAAPSSKRKGSSDDDSDDEPSPAPAPASAAKKRAKAAPNRTAKPAAPGGNARRFVLDKFADALRAAQRETSERTEDDPTVLAEALEEALHDAYPDGKEYTLKGRSLVFNLKHEKNPGLRARVLRGEITPEALVRMTTAELAPKDLQEMRREREEKIGEDAFVTAEASNVRVVKTSKGEEVVTVGGDAAVDDGDGLGHRGGAPATRPVPPIPSRSPSPGARAEPEALGGRARSPASSPLGTEGDTTAPPEKPAENDDEDDDEDDEDDEDDVAPASFASFEAFAAARAGSDDDDDEGDDAPMEVEGKGKEKGKGKEEEEE